MGRWVTEGILHSCLQESCEDLEMSVSAELLRDAAAALMSAAAAPAGNGVLRTGVVDQGRDQA